MSTLALMVKDHLRKGRLRVGDGTPPGVTAQMLRFLGARPAGS